MAVFVTNADFGLKLNIVMDAVLEDFQVFFFACDVRISLKYM